MIEANIIEFYSDPEGEENESDLTIQPQDFYNTVTWGTDWTVETILTQILKNNINLEPKFQRRNAWSKQKKSLLIESIILGIPIPEIILAEDKKKGNS